MILKFENHKNYFKYKGRVTFISAIKLGISQ